MDMLKCSYCNSTLVSMIAVKVKHKEFAERNINIQNEYVSMKDPIGIKIFLRCVSCDMVSDVIIRNRSGCCSIEGIEPKNEIIYG